MRRASDNISSACGTPNFVEVAAPTDDELHALLQTLPHCSRDGAARRFSSTL